MTTANIRITADGERRDVGGLVGALTGASEPGASRTVEIDLTELSGGDVAAILPVLAETYRTAFHGERVLTGEFTFGEIPFPEAGDPHPFERPEEEATPESTRVGTPWLDESMAPRPADCYLLRFEDGSEGLYLFDGRQFMHPASQHEPGDYPTSPVFSESRYGLQDPIIKAAVLVARHPEGSD